MGRRSGLTKRLEDAMAFVPDDLPDGAFWAMAHEFAGLDYGDGFSSAGMNGPQEASYRKPEFKIPKRITKQLAANGYEIRKHDAYHFTARRDGKYIADWWPHKQQWRIDGKLQRGDAWQFQAALVSKNNPNK